MKLLFDQNLSPELPRRLDDIFPGSIQALEIDPGGPPDTAIWKHALEHGFVIVTKDSDFYWRNAQAPEEVGVVGVVWLRIGNRRNAETALILRNHRERILTLAEPGGPSIVEISG